MKKLYLIVFIFICFFSCQNISFGAHIIGGEVTYNCKGFNADSSRVTFEVIFTLFRDSRGTGAIFEQRFSFGIYRYDGTSYTHVRNVVNVPITNVIDIDIQNDNPCIVVPVNVGVQKGTYKFEVTLDVIDDTYYIAYQRCCRNNTILNIVNAADTGAAIATEISPESQRSCNNSPTFEEFPPALLCVNRPIKYDHSAIDVDGDSPGLWNLSLHCLQVAQVQEMIVMPLYLIPLYVFPHLIMLLLLVPILPLTNLWQVIL